MAGLGIEGDAHQGTTVKHRSRVARNPAAPNLRQVHLIHAELHDELRQRGFEVKAGQMGENITTHGVDLLGLPAGTRLCLGSAAVIEVTGLRNPCAQLDRIQPGLMAATLGRDEHGNLVRKAGIMGIVVAGGEVRPGDPIRRFAIGKLPLRSGGWCRPETRRQPLAGKKALVARMSRRHLAASGGQAPN